MVYDIRVPKALIKNLSQADIDFKYLELKS